MNFLKSFLFLIFLSGVVSANVNVSLDDVGSVYVFIENQRDTFINVDKKRAENYSKIPSDDAWSLEKNNTAIFYLGSPCRKSCRLEKKLLDFKTCFESDKVQFFGNDDVFLFEFGFGTRFEWLNPDSNQENFSISFVLKQLLKGPALSREFNGNILSFDFADIYFVKIVITNSGVDFKLVQKILKIGDKLPELKFSENKF